MNNIVFDTTPGKDKDKSILLDTDCEKLAFPSLSEYNGTRTHNHLVPKRRLDHSQIDLL